MSEAKTAIEIIESFKTGKKKASEIVEETFEHIELWESKINAYITLCKEEASQRAEELDKKLRNGEPLGKLAGLPIAIKDNIITKGILTTCGSKILQNYIPPYNATVIERLIKEDAIIVGKTNMDEFAMGSSTEYSAYKVTKNPIDLERVPGGSSGGSAATVASGAVCVSLGTDTGGSIRQPASFCGVVGFKPTYGRVSRYGLVAFASSLDQIGPIARNVDDAALIYSVIAGQDKLDSTSLDVPVESPFLPLQPLELEKTRFAIPIEFLGEGLQNSVRNTIYDAIKKANIKAEEISIPSLTYSIPTYYIIAPAEMSSNLARYDGVRYGVRERGNDLISMYENTRTNYFGVEVKRRIMIGTFVLSAGYYEAYFAKAARTRRLIALELEKAFEKYDFIISPTSPTTAFKLNERLRDPIEMYLADVYTTVANLAGIPAISIPCGKDENGLPVGMQIMAARLEDRKLLACAHEIESRLRDK